MVDCRFHAAFRPSSIINLPSSFPALAAPNSSSTQNTAAVGSSNNPPSNQNATSKTNAPARQAQRSADVSTALLPDEASPSPRLTGVCPSLAGAGEGDRRSDEGCADKADSWEPNGERAGVRCKCFPPSAFRFPIC